MPCTALILNVHSILRAQLADTRKQLANKQAELELVLSSASDKEQAIVKVSHRQ